MILFGDLVSMILIVYVWVRLADNHDMDGHSKIVYAVSGVFLVALLVLDQVWQYRVITLPFSAHNDAVLDVLTSFIYTMIPMAAGMMSFMSRHKLPIWIYMINSGIFLFLIGAPLANIWYPLLFRHQDTYITFTSFHAVYVILEFLILIAMVRQYYMRNFAFDASDRVMLFFALGIVGVGVLAEVAYADLTVTWICICICYLMLLLALEQMHAKTDPVTRIRNRAAYTIDLARIENEGRRRKLIQKIYDFWHREAMMDFYLAGANSAEENPGKYYGKNLTPLTVVMFDLNYLKRYNDMEGHLRGMLT